MPAWHVQWPHNYYWLLLQRITQLHLWDHENGSVSRDRHVTHGHIAMACVWTHNDPSQSCKQTTPKSFIFM